MRGLTITLGAASAERLDHALVLLLATAALGGRARLFLEGAAVALLADPPRPLWGEALDAGVAVLVCQTGLASTELSAEALDPRYLFTGPVAMLADLGDDRLAIA